MRVFIGCTEIANIMYQYVSAFEQLGVDVKTLVFAKNRFYLEHEFYDRVLEDEFRNFKWTKHLGKFSDKARAIYSELAAVKYLREIVDEVDVFIFISGSFSKFGWDLPYLKKKGKKIVFLHCGTDVRHYEAFCQEFGIDVAVWKKNYPDDPLNKKMKYLRNVEKNADLIFSVPDQAGLSVRPYFHLKIPFTISKTADSVPQRLNPRIVHCPSRRDIKGSDRIAEVVNRLHKDGYKFDYLEVVNRPNHEVLKELELADVVIDELYFPGPGVLGLEAMSFGTVECTRHIPNQRAGWLPPVISIDHDNLYDQMKAIIENRDLRQELANRGRQYLMDSHSPAQIAKEMMFLLGNIDVAPHYFPRFYLDKYIPKDELISYEMQERTKEILLLHGCSRNTDIFDSIERGVLPSMNSTEIGEIERWTHE